MTLKEFVDTNWHRGNVVKLKNGKEYLCKGTKGHGKYLLLYSLEYDSCFVADYRIVECQVSDYEEPEELYLEQKRKRQEEAAAKQEAERQEHLRAKAERKQQNIDRQERIHRETVARKAAAKAQRQQTEAFGNEVVNNAVNKEPINEHKLVEPAETPKEVKAAEPASEAPKKRVRQRIRVSSTPIREKVEYFNKK